MKKLGIYQGSDLPFFKRFELDLAYEGVTIIRGVNKNVVGMAERNNGSGKSLLLSGLAEILISSNPGIERNEMVARKVLFPKNTSSIMLEIDNKVIAKGRFGGATVSYGIESGSGGLEKVKKDVATEYLAESLGYNEDLFYTLVYLDGGREFPLIIGTPTQRVQFLSNIFADIEMFGEFHSHFSEKLRDFQHKLNKKLTLEEELSELIGTDDVEQLEVADEDIEKLESKLAKYRRRLKVIQTEISSTEMYTTFKRLESEITKNSKVLGLNTLGSMEELYKNAKTQMTSEIENRRASRDYKALSSRVESAKESYDALVAEKKELDNSDMDDSNYDMIEQSDAMADTYREWASQVQTVINDVSKKLSVPFRIGLPSNPSQYNDCHTLLDMLTFFINDRGSLVIKQSSKSPTAIGKKLSSQDTMVALSTIGKVRKNIEELLDSKVDLSTLGTPLTKEEIKKAREARKRSMRWQEVDDLLAETRQEYRRLKADLAEKNNPETLDIKKFDTLGKLVRDLDILDSLGFNGDEIQEVPDLVALQELASNFESKILEVRGTITELKETKRFKEENESVIDSLKSSILKLGKYDRAVPLMSSIKKAFSNNGIRIQVLNNLTNQLSERMNQHSHLVFPEPIQFEFNLTEKACDILAKRNPGSKHEMISDIRTLSRGERKSFNLLLLYCLLPMIPNNKRLNVVVMDEMTSNMDQPTKLKVFRDFIPALRDVVPHIILADTGNLEIDDAREYNVVKQGSVSTLETA